MLVLGFYDVVLKGLAARQSMTTLIYNKYNLSYFAVSGCKYVKRKAARNRGHETAISHITKVTLTPITTTNPLCQMTHQDLL